MLPIDLASARPLLEALIAAFSIVGGAMACASGFNADQAITEGRSADIVARRINEGVGYGFRLSWRLSAGVFAIMAAT
jgi:hypothetical protein